MLLNESTKPEYIFDNDADDMRALGKAINPRVMISDQSNDQIKWAIIYGNVNSFIQNLQLEYTNMLIAILIGKQNENYSNHPKSMAFYNFKNIRTMAKVTGNISSMTHKQHLRILIDNALKEVK